MKKILLTLGMASVFALTSQAAIILDEPFSYADGGLTNVSSGAWTNHSGANNGSVTVSGGKITLVTTAAEDVMRSLPISYTDETLFASFTVNFSVLPTATTYFAHFAQTSSTFKSRIWSTTNGAAAGKFRLGITSSVSTGGANNNIQTDLDLNTEYKVVMRFVGGTNATLWINPTSEASIVNRADGTDVNTLGSWSPKFFAFRQSSGMGTMDIDNLLIGDQFSDVQTVGGPPSISGLVAVSIPGNSNTGPLPFLISDVETPAASLTVTATSDNPTLVPNNPANLTFGGSGANRTLTVTPAIGQQGNANIEVVVTDGNSETATNTFAITVGYPTISSVPNVIAPVNATSGPLVFTVTDSETAAGSLTVTATSSDQVVLPDANIGIISGGSTRSLYLTNVAAGFTTVTVTVNDGVFNVPTSFVLTVYPENGVLLADDFGYSDGSIAANSSGLWMTHSAGAGDTNQTQVVAGQLLLNNTASEDINRWFTNAPVFNTGGQLIYTRMVLNLSALPTASGVGDYFTHVYGFSGAYRARVFTRTNGAAPGTYRLAISSSSFTPSVFPQDLSLNSSYVLISRYNTATAEATLWVNPASESSQNVSATDTSSTITAYGIAFRQSTGIGSMSIDDLVVGSSFADVFLASAPAPIALQIAPSGSDVVLTWANPQFQLQAAPTVTGTFTNVPGATSPYPAPATGDQRYFRLVYP
jgi:hypothetical protein